MSRKLQRKVCGKIILLCICVAAHTVWEYVQREMSKNCSLCYFFHFKFALLWDRVYLGQCGVSVCVCVCACGLRTCRPPRRAGPEPCDEPCGNRSSSRLQSACERSDRAAEPSGCQCRTSPWTWPAGSWTDTSAGCSGSSAEIPNKVVCGQREREREQKVERVVEEIIFN